MGESAHGDVFDEIRKIRNSVNYYGKEISVTEAADVIVTIKKLRKSVLVLF